MVHRFIRSPQAKDECRLIAAQIVDGSLLRPINRYDHIGAERLSAQAVALIVKRRAAAAGLDPSLYSGHSLRAGFATNAAGVGASATSIRAQTGHRSDAMLQRYIRHSQLFHDNPNAKMR
jgi:integrase